MILQLLNQEKMRSLLPKGLVKNIKKIREANAKKQKYKIPGEIVKIEEVETPQGQVKVLISIEKQKATKKVIKKYDKIRHEKKI